ncbi:MAG: NADH-quinone oxidoreductase subunit H [Candidatus Omnitrophica bacterium]|nr:NADH-quinone oxidoreductase subunit H [Candidatus Omnitrophota bacterium]
MMKIPLAIIQLIFIILFSPFLSGLITKIKNTLRMRKGQGVFQPYLNLRKLFLKREVISETASWVFGVAPFVVMASVLTAALLIPMFIGQSPLGGAGDFFVLIFVLALGRFFLALAALDAGSSFTGMGSSREMFISSLAEPAVCLVIFSVSLQFGSTGIAASFGMHPVPVSLLVAGIALFMVIIAETSRIPVDNQETHLELTMVHEAMILEYSGKRLALIEWAAYIKQMLWFFVIAQLIFPIASFSCCNNFSGLISWGMWYLARIMIIVIAVAIVEVSLAKMRLFRVADFLGFGFVLAVISVICAILRI